MQNGKTTVETWEGPKSLYKKELELDSTIKPKPEKPPRRNTVWMLSKRTKEKKPPQKREDRRHRITGERPTDWEIKSSKIEENGVNPTPAITVRVGQFQLRFQKKESCRNYWDQMSWKNYFFLNMNHGAIGPDSGKVAIGQTLLSDITDRRKVAFDESSGFIWYCQGS